MSEILFRGKRIDNGEWVEGYCFRRPSVCNREITVPFIMPGDIINGGIYVGYEVKPETVSQYTGLLDSGGEMIYEGDIVECRDENSNITFDAAVEFGNPNKVANWGYQLRFLSGDKSGLDILHWVSMEENGVFINIVGNIHDNSKSKKDDQPEASWIGNKDFLICSKCLQAFCAPRLAECWSYCPGCGAKMGRKVGKENE